MSSLFTYLTEAQKGELEAVRKAAEHILAQPLDLTFTDHTITHCNRIVEHLNVLLSQWAESEVGKQPERTRAEIFILLAAVYLHDIGMQFQLFEQCPSVEEYLPTLAEALTRSGYQRGPEGRPFTPESLEFARDYHHLLSYDWITQVNLRSPHELAPFEDTGLKTYVDHVARVCWAHNVSLTDEHSYSEYVRELANAQEQVGEIRLGLLAAFLRMGDFLDQDHRRVDVNKLRRIEIPHQSQAHWWKHHFIRTSRLDEHRTDRGWRLHLVFTVPREHEPDIEWIKPALCSSTIEELRAEQDRLRGWLSPVGVWIDLPTGESCEVKFDVTGRVHPMPSEVLEIFRRAWPKAEGEAVQVRFRNALEQDSLTADDLGEPIRSLGVYTEIEDYLHQLDSQYAQGFRNTPYTPIELDYGEFRDALEALEELLRQPDPIPRPIVLLGEPGGGKTTLVRRYVLDCARGDRTPEYLPIYVEAKRYGEAEWAAEMEARLDIRGRQVSPEQYSAFESEILDRLLRLIAETLCDLAKVSYHHSEAMRRYLLQVMARKSCLIVIDGLNEAPPLLRWLTIQAVQSFVREYRRHRVLITSREGDYHEDYFRSSRVQRLKMLQTSAIRSYWGAIGIDKTTQDRIFSSELHEVARLARNPMYMYMLGELLKGGETEAIGDAGRLFQRFTDKSLWRWHNRDAAPLIQVEEMKALLAEVAFHAFEKQKVAFGPEELKGGMDAWWATLPQARRIELCQEGDSSSVLTENLVEELDRRLLATGFVQRLGSAEESLFSFRHHTAQDYFAALAIARKVEELPEIVKHPIFHEALSIIPDIIENPNTFLRQLNASTSEEIGRAKLLVLSFRVAGSVRGRIDPEVMGLLFAGALPLLQAVVALYLPYAAEVLGYFFSHLGWQELGRFLAKAAGNESLSPMVRRFADKRIKKAVEREDRVTQEAIRDLFGDAIPEGVWRDYHSAQEVIQNISGGQSQISMFPLFIGGLATTISLLLREKQIIARSLGRMTPNQIGTLQMIFIEEVSTWGAISMKGVHDSFLLKLHQEYSNTFALMEEDTLLLQGRILEAINGYLAAWKRVGVKHLLLERLVLLSSQMSPDQVEVALKLTSSYEGELLGWSGYQDRQSDSEALYVIRRIGRVTPRVQEILESIPWSASPWLLLWREIIQRRVRRNLSQFPERFREIVTRLDLDEPSGLLFLNTAKSLVGFRDVVDPLLEKHYPERPALKIEGLKKALQLLPANRLEGELSQWAQEFGYHKSIINDLLLVALETFDLELIFSFVDGLSVVDRSLQFTLRMILLTKLARKKEMVELNRLMDQWGITLSMIATGNDYEVLRAQYEFGNKEPVLQALRAQDHMEAYKLRIELHEEEGELEIAAKIALEGLDRVLSIDTDTICFVRNPNYFTNAPIDFVNSIERLANKLSTSEDASTREEILRELARKLLSLLGDPTNGDWAFKALEHMRNEVLVELDAYAQRIEEVLCSSHAWAPTAQRTSMLKILCETGHHDAVLRAISSYVEACPQDPAESARYIGNGAWYTYLVGDYHRFEELTENALTLAPEEYQCDWLLGNRGFARLLRGEEQEAMDAYAETRKAVSDRERWQQITLHDLEQHPERRPGAEPFPPELIDRVRKLGEDLPKKEPEDSNQGG